MSTLLPFDHALIRERRAAAMARARYSRDHKLSTSWIASAVHEARCWNRTLIFASRDARRHTCGCCE